MPGDKIRNVFRSSDRKPLKRTLEKMDRRPTSDNPNHSDSSKRPFIKTTDSVKQLGYKLKDSIQRLRNADVKYNMTDRYIHYKDSTKALVSRSRELITEKKNVVLDKIDSFKQTASEIKYRLKDIASQTVDLSKQHIQEFRAGPGDFIDAEIINDKVHPIGFTDNGQPTPEPKKISFGFTDNGQPTPEPKKISFGFTDNGQPTPEPQKIPFGFQRHEN